MSANAAFWANFTLQSYNCFYAIMVWDMLISLRKEKHRIWDREWSIVKCIYIFNRYYGLAAMTMNLCFYNIHVSRAQCQKYVRAEPGSSIAMILSYQSILLVRCFAVWGRDKVILFIGLAMMMAQLIVQAYATSTMFPTPFPSMSSPNSSQITPSQSSDLDIVPCVVNGAKAWIASYFLFPTCTDTVLTVLTFARVLYITQSTKTRLVVTFMKEGFAFFMVVFVANVFNGILYLQDNTDISTIGSGFAIMMGNVCANHLILRSLKRVKRHYHISDDRIYLSTITNLNSEAVFTTRLDDTISNTVSSANSNTKFNRAWTQSEIASASTTEP